MNFHQLQQLQGALSSLLFVHALMLLQHFTNLFADGVQRVQRTHGFLKNHCNAVAANIAHLSLTGLQQVSITMEDLAGWVAGRGWQQTQNAVGGN